MATERLPGEAFELQFVTRVQVEPEGEYVLYRDGSGTYAVEAACWDTPTDEEDYSEWCSVTPAVDHELCRRIARAAELACINAAGDGRLVYVDDPEITYHCRDCGSEIDTEAGEEFCAEHPKALVESVSEVLR